MTRKFFNRVLAGNCAITKKYLYTVEVSDGLKKIIRYRRRPDGSCWFDDAYICAVYAL